MTEQQVWKSTTWGSSRFGFDHQVDVIIVYSEKQKIILTTILFLDYRWLYLHAKQL